jgi:signal transduction histidine kinase
MRPLLKIYIALIATSAAALLLRDLLAVPESPHPWSWALLLSLAALCVLAQHMQFQVARGWFSTAGAVAAIASALLLPTGLAELVLVIGAGSRMVRMPQAPAKAIFNLGCATLSIAATAHLAALFGGPTLLSDPSGWPGLPVAAGMATVYYVVSAAAVAGAVALDQRRSFWGVLRSKIGVKTVAEVGLGLVGATLAVVVSVVPGWAPALVLPAALVFLAKQSMETADRRSKNLAMTSAVGRAVAGTLNPQLAFEAITTQAVRDELKVEGLALMPIGSTPAFAEYVACTEDQPLLRELLAREIANDPTTHIEVRGDGKDTFTWLPNSVRELRIGATAVQFGADGRQVGVLIAWRLPQAMRSAAFSSEELLVLDTLADYAAVALESARLANEMARMSRDAAAAEAMREVESLRDLARLKDEFLGQVSHELRTPLTIIHGYAELISDGILREDTQIRETAREVHTNSSLMLRLVDDLLDTSRLESGRLSLQSEVTDLAPWLERTVVAFAQASSGHVVQTDLPTSLPLARVDLDRLGQVVNNLLSNAVRYSAEGSQVLVSARALAREVEIRVKDQGIGIAADERERIFEKFYRGKDGATHSVRGTGLGLAVAKMLVDAHLGRISVDSEVGRGSTFIVRLPIVEGVTALPAAA